MANVQIKRYSGSAWVDINPKTTIGQVINLSSQLANMQSDIDDKAPKTHSHGNITDGGAIGSTPNLMVKTGTSGKLTALTAGSTSQFLRGDGTWATPSYARVQGRVVTDMNHADYRVSGIYGISGSPTNGYGETYGALIVANNLDTGLQIAGGFTNDDLYFRGWSDGGANYTAWRKVWHDGNLTNLNQLTNGPGYVDATHKHNQLYNTTGDTRNIPTLPSDYNNILKISGYKDNAAVGRYGSLMGVNGYSDSSGGVLELSWDNGRFSYRTAKNASEWNPWGEIASEQWVTANTRSNTWTPTWSQVTDKPDVIIEEDYRLTNARPASDVSAWAKKSSLALSDVPTISIAKGGTGATTALAARANLGLGNGATASNVIRQSNWDTTNKILTIEVV